MPFLPPNSAELAKQLRHFATMWRTTQISKRHFENPITISFGKVHLTRVPWLSCVKADKTRKGGNDALPLKAARRDAIAKLKSFGGFESEQQTNPNAVSFAFAVGRHVNAA